MKFKTFGDVSGDGSGEESKLTRRRFVRGGAAVGAGGSLLLKTSKSALGQEATPEGVIRCGIIGYGDQGKWLRESATFLKDRVSFPAVADIWERNRRAGVGQICGLGQGVGDGGKTCTGYDEVEKMLAGEDLDAVIIATPPFFHRRYTEMAMESGLHVYCEAPMSNSLADAQGMVRLQRRTGKLLQIGYQCRSLPRYRHVHDSLIEREKLFGWLTQAEAHWNRSLGGSMPRDIPRARDAVPDAVLERHGFATGAQGQYEFRNWERFRAFGIGSIHSRASHQVDVFNWFFGEMPRSVQASGGSDFYSSNQIGSWLGAEVEHAMEVTKSAKRRAALRVERDLLRNVERWRDPECLDDLMTIYEYATPRERWGTHWGEGDTLTSRAVYRSSSSSSSQSFYETFMGEFGAIGISQIGLIDRVYREGNAPDWSRHLEGDRPLLRREYSFSRGGEKNPELPNTQGFAVLPVIVNATTFPPVYILPDHVRTKERGLTPHLRNFFDTVANGGGQEQLNCPAEEAYRALVTVLKTEEAIAKQATVDFAAEDFVVG